MGEKKEIRRFVTVLAQTARHSLIRAVLEVVRKFPHFFSEHPLRNPEPAGLVRNIKTIMKKFTIPICAVAFLGLTAFFASACSNGNAKDFVKDFSEAVYNADSKDAKYVTKYKEFGRLSKLNVSRGIEVYYTTNASEKTEVKAVIDETLAPYFEAKMENGTLKLSFTKNVKIKDDCIKVYLTAASPQQVALSSGASLQMQNDLNVNRPFSLEMSSGADAEFKGIKCTSCSITLSSGADTDIDHLKCDNLALTSSSGADADIEKITAGKISVNTSSGANTDIEDIKCQDFSASASSGADCTFKGKCTETAVLNASSAASIDVREMTARNISLNESSGGSVSHKAKNVIKNTAGRRNNGATQLPVTRQTNEVRSGSDARAM